MQTISNVDLDLVIGGASGSSSALMCTPDNPTGKPPQQYASSSTGPSPSMNDRIMNATNTMTSRGMSMLNDGRPSMPDQW